MDAKLQGTVILVVGVAKQQTVIEFYEEIQKLGGETSIIFSPKRTTHVVASKDFLEGSPTRDHYDVVRAKEAGCKIISLDWLQQCIMMGMRVPEEQYEIKWKQAALPKFSKIKPTPVKGYTGDKTAPNFPEEHQIFDEIVLQVTDFQHNFNKYYSLEFHYGKLGEKEVFRIFSHYGRTDDLEANPNSGKKECRYFPNFAAAAVGMRGVYEEKTSERKGYKPILLVHSNIGSDVRKAKAKAKTTKKKDLDPFAAAGGHEKEKEEEEEEESKSALDFEPKANSRLHPTIQIFVNYIFTEAAAALSSSIAAKITSRGIETPLGILNKDQVESGDEVLMEIYETLNEEGEDKAHKEGPTRQKLRELSGKFYTIIPHRIGRSKIEVEKNVIDTFGAFEAKQELLQLMKDLLDVTKSQGDGSKNLSVLEMKYQALKNEMCLISPTSQAFDEIKNYVLSTQTNTDRYMDKTIEVTNVFGLNRPKEVETFDKESERIHPQKLLFHGSRVSNWVGLLSRGILMPKVIVRAGGKRTDAGLLGNGMYFASSSSAASQYASAGVLGTRYMMCCRVATGRSKQYTDHQIGLSAPPANYESVQGLAKSPSSYSAFHDEEFVIFNPSQQRQEYLVEFKVHEKPLPSLLSSGARTPSTVTDYKMTDPTCLLAEHPSFSSSSSSSSYSTSAYAMPKPTISTSSDLFSVVNVDSLSPQKSSSTTVEAKSPSAASASSFSAAIAAVPPSPSFSVSPSSPPFSTSTPSSPSFRVSGSSMPSPSSFYTCSPSSAADPFAWDDNCELTESPSEALKQSLETDYKSPSERLSESIYSSVDEDPFTSSYEAPPSATPLYESSPSYSPSSSSPSLPFSLKQEKEAEDTYRQLFVNSRFSSDLQNPYVHLIDIFSERASFTAQRKSEEEEKVPVLLSSFVPALQQGQTTAVPENQFNERWNKLTCGLLDNIAWEGVFAAGGAVLKCVDARGVAYEDSSDIDLFFYGMSDSQAEEKIRSVFEEISGEVRRRFGYEPEIIRTKHAITILGVPPVRHFQIILRMYHSPAEVLMGFDVDSCTFGFDGKKAYTLPRGRRSLTKGFNLVDLSRRSLTYEHRLLKYSKRGFAVLVPGYDREKVSSGLFNPSRGVQEVTGLAKLALLDYRVLHPVVGRRKGAEDESQEDYMSVFLPWGKPIKSIVAMLKGKDIARFFAKKKAGGGVAGYIVVFGLDSVLSGKAREGERGEGDSLSGRISWLRGNPGQQGGVSNGLLTGSFNPVDAESWERDAYKTFDEVPGSSAVPSSSYDKKPSFASATKTTPKKKPALKATSTPKKSANVHFDFSKPAKDQGAIPEPSAFQVSPGPWGTPHAPVSSSSSSSSTQDSPPLHSSANAFQVSPGPWSTPKSKKVNKEPSTTPTSSRVLNFNAPPASPFSAAPIFSSPQTSAPTPTPTLTPFSLVSSLTPPPTPTPTPTSTSAPPPTTTPAKSAFSFAPSLSSPSPAPFSLLKPSPAPAASPTPFSFAPSPAPTPTVTPTSVFTPTRAPSLSSAFNFSSPAPPPSPSSSPSSFAHIEHVFDQTAPKTPCAKLLLLISLLSKGGLLTGNEKDVLKDLVIAENENLLCALEVFEIQKDFEEMADTLKEIAELGL